MRKIIATLFICSLAALAISAQIIINPNGSGGGSGGAVWGAITGILSDQTDLQTALDDKQDTITFGTGVEAALGVNIGAAGGVGTIQFIEQQTPTGTGEITFSSLGNYTHLEIRWSARGTQAATAVNLLTQFNTDTGSNYDQEVYGAGGSISVGQTIGTTSGLLGNIAAASATAGYAGVGTATIYDYRGTSLQKSLVSMLHYRIGTASGNLLRQSVGSSWRSTAAITSIRIFLSAGNFDTGSKITLYGIY